MNTISPIKDSDPSAMQQIHRTKHSLDNDQLLKQVADKLGIDPSKLQAAFKEAKGEGKKGQDLLAAVANKLGVQLDALQQALQQARQGSKAHHHHHHGGQQSGVSSVPTDQNLTAQTQGVESTINVTA